MGSTSTHAFHMSYMSYMSYIEMESGNAVEEGKYIVRKDWGPQEQKSQLCPLRCFPATEYNPSVQDGRPCARSS